MKAVLFIVCALAVIHTAQATAVARCWFGVNAATSFAGHLTLTQEEVGLPVSIAGLVNTSLTGVHHLYARSWGAGNTAGACYQTGAAADTALITFQPTSSLQESFSGETSAINLFGAQSIIGRSIYVFLAEASCAGTTIPVASCVVGIANAAGVAAANQANSTWGTTGVQPASAVAILSAGPGAGAATGGQVTFTQNWANMEMYVHVEVTGLAASSTHGLHVHWYGDMTTEDGLSMGGHWNPLGFNHGQAPSFWRHMGDIGNFVADGTGAINEVRSVNLLTFVGFGSIVGRGVVFHELADDYNPLNTSASVGNAGTRWARGVIGVSATRPADITPALANCWMAGLGNIVLSQMSVSEPVMIYGQLASTLAAKTYSLHAFANGDLFMGTSQGACVNTAPLLSVTTQAATTTLLSASTTAINLFDDATNVIGRSLGLYEGTANCASAGTVVTGTQCVIGIAGVGGEVNNKAVSNLATAPTSAVCQIAQSSTYVGSGLTGAVTFSASDVAGEVIVQANIAGVGASTTHGLHVHWFGDMTDPTAVGMGGHLNPLGFNHGQAPSYWRHMGDIGNTVADANGVINYRQSVNLLTFVGLGNIVGRGVVFHAVADDYNPLNTSTSVGNAGARWGRCVIGISERAAPMPTSSSSTGSSSVSSTGTGSVAVSSGTGTGTGTVSVSTGTSPVVSTGGSMTGSMTSTGTVIITSTGPAVSAASTTSVSFAAALIVGLVALAL